MDDHEALLNKAVACEELALFAGDKSIREKSAELARLYRALANVPAESRQDSDDASRSKCSREMFG